jgi:dihydroorotate dehydrogenase electron transfer subunit
MRRRSSTQRSDAGTYQVWDLLLPPPQDQGTLWLTSLHAGSAINLIGPLGTGFPPPDHAQNLLVTADLERMGLLIPLIDDALDHRCRIALVARIPVQDATNTKGLLQHLPLAVEVSFVRSHADWQAEVVRHLSWADRVAAAIPQADGMFLAEAIRSHRLRMEPGFAHVLMETHLLCGVGACGACLLPSAGHRWTRACVDGPVMELGKLFD